MSRRRSRTVALLVSVILIAALGAPARAQEATPPAGVFVLPPGEAHAGLTPGEWNARWWQWFLSFPEESSPATDTAGDRCTWGQSGPVFFIAATIPAGDDTPTCVVPEGVALLVTGGTVECSTVEPAPFFGRDEAELSDCANAQADLLTEAVVEIDGEAVPDIEAYLVEGAAFPLMLPEGNLLGVPAGPALSVSVGLPVIIEPLPAGEYVIATSTTYSDAPDEPFAGEIRIVVTPPQVIEPTGESTPGATPAA